MHILILGAAGMVGRKLTERLLRDGRLGKHEITRMTLQDVVAPTKPANARSRSSVVASDFADAGAAAPLIAHRPDVIFHLAAIVSGEAEAEFDKGYRINLDGTRYLIDAIRARRWRLQAAAGVHVLDRGVRCAVPGKDRRRILPYAADELRHAEIDLRTPDQRLHPQGPARRHQYPPADDLRAAGQAEQGGFRILLQHHPRAARGRGGGAAGFRRRAALARLTEIGGRLPGPRRHHGPQCDGRAAQSQHARACR